MKRYFTLCSCAVLLAAVVYAAHSSEAPLLPGGARGRVTLLFSGDSRGLTEPVRACACYEKPVAPLGGLPRRASFVRQARQSGDGVLLLDAGNTLIDPDDPVVDPAGPRRVASALGAMGYDAVGLGSAELLAGSGDDGWVAALGAPLVAVNLRGANLPEHQGAVTRAVGDVRVAVLGAAEPSAIPEPLRDRLDLTVEPVAAALAGRLTQLGPVDLVVVLLQGTFEEASALAASLGGVDVIVAGRSDGLLYDTRAVGSTLVVQALPGGGHVGRLRLEVHDRGRPTVLADERVALDDSYPDDPLVSELLGG
jgi:2',3'-cyclic-nucleotide 2'-phosphodiesterase (5'-nucleotidase family)